MKSLIAKFRWILPIIFFVLCIALALNIIKYSILSSEYYRTCSARLTAKEQIDTSVGYFIQGFTLGLLNSGSDKDATTYAIYGAAVYYEQAAARFSWILFWLAIIGIAYLIINVYIFREPTSVLIIGLIGISFLFLLIGLIAPIMSFFVYGDIPVIGRCIAKYESKGILSAAITLFTTGKWFVATLIVVFSVFTPITKLLLSIAAIKAPSPIIRNKAIGVIKAIGKWSMADVFVVGILLAIFSLQSGPGNSQGTDAQIGYGLYFFAGYCIFSLIVGHLLIHSKEQILVPVTNSSDLNRQKTLISVFRTLGFGFIIVIGGFMSANVIAPRSQLLRDNFVVECNSMGTRAIIATKAPGTLFGWWTSSGAEFKGADDTIVTMSVKDPIGNTLLSTGHQSKGNIMIPVTKPGVYSVVFDNVGIIRSTARRITIWLKYEPE